MFRGRRQFEIYGAELRGVNFRPDVTEAFGIDSFLSPKNLWNPKAYVASAAPNFPLSAPLRSTT